MMVLGMLLVMVCVAGCAGIQNATVSIEDQTINTKNGTGEVIKFHSSSLGLLIPPPCPDQMGRLIEARANANLTEALATQIKSGGAANVIGQYTGIIVNQDPIKTAFVHHPSLNKIVEIRPGGYKTFIVTEIPDYVTVRFSGEKENQRMKIYKKTKVYQGIKTDFGARIES